MTIDTNGSLISGGNGVANHIELDGDNCTVDHVEIINGYGSFPNSQEAFNVKIASWYNPSISQDVPISNAQIYNCYAHSWLGTYGSAFDIFSIGATGTTAYTANAKVHDNYCVGYNGGTTSVVAGNLGFVGDGIEIYANTCTNCDNFFGSEGPANHVQVHDNQIRNARTTAISMNTVGSNSEQYWDVYNNDIEISTIQNDIGTSHEPKYALSGLGNGTDNYAGRVSFHDNRVTLLLAGVQTATRAQSGTLVTITTSTAHGMNNGDAVFISGLGGGAAFNGNYYSITVNNSTSFSYSVPSSLSGTVSTTADTGGTVGEAAYGFNISSNTTEPVEIYNNIIDDNCPNIFVSSYPVYLTYRHNFTFKGAPLLLASGPLTGAYSSLPAQIEFNTVNDPVTNGNNLLAAYQQALSIYPNNSAPSATNRITILMPPGTYNLGSQSLFLSSKYIDLVGIGAAADTLVTSSTKTIQQNANINDFQLKDFTLTTSSTADGGTTAAFWIVSNESSPTAERYEDMIFNGAGTNNDYHQGGGTGATFLNCRFLNSGMPGGGQGTLAGTLDRCSFEGTSTYSNVYVASTGLIKNSTFAAAITFYGMAGLFEKNDVVATGTNTDATYLGQYNTANGSFYYNRLVATGTGKSINSYGATSIQTAENIMNNGFGANVTNNITTPYNVIDTHVKANVVRKKASSVSKTTSTTKKKSKPVSN